MENQPKRLEIDHEDDQNIISIYNEKNRSGVALFDETKETIFVTSIVESEATDYQNLTKFLLLNSFSKAILPPKLSKEFLETLIHLKSLPCNSENEQEHDQKQLETKPDASSHFLIMKKGDFDIENAQNLLFTLDFSSLVKDNSLDLSNISAETLDRRTKIAYLRTILDLDNIHMIQALGGLLTFLFNTNMINRSYKVENIKMKQPGKNVHMSLKTYNSLSIFKEELHPSQIKGKGRSKEGYSLFTLYDSFMCTAHGRKLLKSWFLNPTFDEIVINDRLYTTEFFLKTLSLAEFEKIKKYLVKCYDLALIIRKFQSGTTTKDLWKKLQYTIENFLHLRAHFQAILEEKHAIDKSCSFPTILLKILGMDSEKISNLSKIFTICLNLKENSPRILINPGVSEEIDKNRKIFDNLSDILTHYAHQEINRLPPDSEISLSISYLPYFGYLVTIPKDIEEPSNHESKSSSQHFSYNESPRFGNQKSDLSTVRSYNRQLSLSQIEEADEDETQYNRSRISQNRGINNNYSFEDDGEGQSQNEKIQQDYEDYVEKSIPIEIQEMMVNQSWDLKFETRSCYFFKSEITRGLDDMIGDVAGKIADLENELILEIENEVLENAIEVIYLSEILSELDCYFCFAQIAKQLNFTKPVIIDESCFMMKNSRHILSEIAGETSFTPNDYFVYNYKDDYDFSFESEEKNMINKHFSNKIMLISGPNLSGKSIYLKQIGLITFMCHIGSYVPASLCKIGLVDKILSIIHLNDSLNDESGFGEEMQDLAQIFRLATNRSLILIDEFAKNTHYEAGLALTMTLLTYFRGEHFKTCQHQFSTLSNQQTNLDMIQQIHYDKIPTCILVTHYLELFQRALIKEDYFLRFFTMEAILQSSTKPRNTIQEQNEEESNSPINLNNQLKKASDQSFENIENEQKLIFSHKIKPGFTLKSYAIFCAHQAGFDKNLLSRMIDIQRTESSFLKPVNSVIKKYEDTTMDLIYRINDIFAYKSSTNLS